MNPSLKQQLKKWKQEHRESTPKKKKRRKKTQKHQEEHLSEREWKDLMGMNMPTYSKHKGAWRQR